MNNTNPIFEALNELNENYAAEAVSPGKTKMKKPLKITLIAAVSAAALAMIVGFVGTNGGKHKFSFGVDDLKNRGFYLDLFSHELTVPEEFKPQPGEYTFSDKVNMPPSELFEKFGLTLPINDNFTEVTDEQPSVEVTIIGGTDVEFEYILYNKTIGKNVYFEARYFSKAENMTYSSGRGILPGEPSEVITLNNGSLCMVSASMAVFSYDGAHYELTLPYEYDEPDNFGDLPDNERRRILAELIEAMPGIDTVKQVLADLGVYDPERSE